MNNIQNQIEKCQQVINNVANIINNRKLASANIDYTNLYNELYALIRCFVGRNLQNFKIEKMFSAD